MSLADHLHTLGDVADLLKDAGVEVVSIQDINDYTRRDRLLVDLRLCVPADLDEGGLAESRPRCYACDAHIDDLLDGDGHPICPECGDNPLPPVGDGPGVEETKTDANPGAVEGSPPEDKGGDDEESPPETRCVDDTTYDGRGGYEDLSDLQRDVVDALAKHGELQTTKLRSVSGAGHSVYDVLTALDEDGWVDRRDDPDDGRRTLVSLTDAAADLVDGDDETDDDQDEGAGNGDQDESDDEGDAGERDETDERVDAGEDSRDGNHAEATEGDGDGRAVRSPRCAECNITFPDTLEYLIHRTEVHGRRMERFGLGAGEFRATVEDSDSVQGVADQLDWSTERVLRALGCYGLQHLVTPGDIHEEESAFDAIAPEWLDEKSFWDAVEECRTLPGLIDHLGAEDRAAIAMLVATTGAGEQLNTRQEATA